MVIIPNSAPLLGTRIIWSSYERLRPPKLASGVRLSVPKRKFRTGLKILCGIPLDFLGLHPAQDIMDEFLLSAEEPPLTRSKSSLGFELQFQ